MHSLGRSPRGNGGQVEPETALLDPPGSRSRPGKFGQELATPVGELVLREALFASAQDSVAEAARVMRQARTSSALVSGDPVGILTSGDLRNRVLADQLPPDTPVADVMTLPVSSLPEDAPLYRALLLMLDHGFEHVPVTRDGQVIGVITHMDMLRHQAHSPMLLLSRIRSLDGLPALDSYADEIAETAQALLTDGLQPARIARVVATLNDALSGRLLQLAQDQLGPPPCPFAWLALGSEGRREQILPSDQDSALAFRDDTPEAAAYFGALATIVVDGNLDEPVWQRARRLTGFSLYTPVDQRPSPDSTDVLVWYSKTAIHFGIRAFEPHGAVRATLADRDRVSTDDNVELHLDTFEVAEAFEVPLAFLLDPANHQRHSLHYRGKLRQYYAMPYKEYFIWGATAGIIMSLYQSLAIAAR